MLGRRRREGNHGFLSCSRLLNCLPKLNDCKTNTSICYRLGFVIYKQCLLEAVMVYNLIAVMYFLEKEGIHQKQAMVRLCTKIWTRSTGRKEPLLPSEKQSLIYKVWRAANFSWKGPKGCQVAEIHRIICMLCYLLCNYWHFWRNGLPIGVLYIFFAVCTTSFLLRMEKKKKNKKRKTPVHLDYI